MACWPAEKQRTFDDLYALVEHLATTGVLSKSKVALQGGSAGGLAAAVAATQRPDLFAAIVASAPLLDLRRVSNGPGADATTIASIVDELGDDDTVLAAYSPYEHIHDRLPPTFIGATSDDVRTPAWHSRKFVARAHDLSPGHVFLRVWKGVGHGTARPAGNRVTSDYLAFVMAHLGLTPPAPRCDQ